MLNTLSARLTDTNVEILGVNFDEDPWPVTLEIAAELDIRFPLLTVEEVTELELRSPDVLPTTYVLSPDNEVVAKLVGMQTLEQIMEQLNKLGIAMPNE